MNIHSPVPPCCSLTEELGHKCVNVALLLWTTSPGCNMDYVFHFSKEKLRGYFYTIWKHLIQSYINTLHQMAYLWRKYWNTTIGLFNTSFFLSTFYLNTKKYINHLHDFMQKKAQPVIVYTSAMHNMQEKGLKRSFTSLLDTLLWSIKKSTSTTEVFNTWELWYKKIIIHLMHNRFIYTFIYKHCWKMLT